MEQPPTLKRSLLNQACDYCRYRKRRCNRLVPRCTMCVEKQQECRYTESLPWQETLPEISMQVPAHSEFGVSASQTTSQPLELFFLDNAMFKRSMLTPQLSPDFRLAAPCLLETLEQADSVTKKFFNWAHLWMPIVSRRKWAEQFAIPLVKSRPDWQILLCSMRLVLWSPNSEGKRLIPQTAYYLSLKRALLDAEMSGCLSLPLLQAIVLISIYELGHAIYPAAYMSIGQCVRVGLALGLDKQSQGDLDLVLYDLDEQEERRRVWWSIFILDRIHLQVRPTSPEPRATDILPTNDQDWDDGVIDTRKLQTVSSPSTFKTGMLARLAQAAYLLSKVLRHKHDPTDDIDFNKQERKQIDQALRALLNLAYQGNSVPVTTICPQTAMCFAALIELHCPDMSEVASINTFNLQSKTKSRQEALELLQPVARQTYQDSGVWFRNRPFTLAQATPLLLPWTFQAAVLFLQLAHWFQTVKAMHEGPDVFQSSNEIDACIMEADLGAATMMRKLALLGGQWSASDAYVRILKTRLASPDLMMAPLTTTGPN